MRYFFAPWSADAIGRRVAPAGAKLVFNFQRGANGLPLFRAEAVPPDGIQLGNGADGRASLQAVTRALGSGLDVSDGLVLDVIFQLVTQNGDPTGVAKWKPLQPRQRDGWMRFPVRGEGETGARFRLSDHPLVLDNLRQNYRALRARGDGGSAKWLWVAENRWGVARRNIIPEDLEDEQPVRPSTVFSEDWNCANTTSGSGGGSRLTALDCDQDWTDFWSEPWEINSNRARMRAFADTEGNPARMNTAIAVDHHAKVQFKRTSGAGGGGSSSRFVGITTRYQNVDTNRMEFYGMAVYEDGVLRVWLKAGGVNSNDPADYTLIDSGNLPGAPSSEYFGTTGAEIDEGPIRGASEGDTHEAWWQDEIIASGVDTTYQTEQHAGIWGFGDESAIDDWEGSDEFPIIRKGRSHSVSVL